MNENSVKVKNIYLPLACIGLALAIMLIDIMFLSDEAYDSPLQGILVVVVGKTILYTVVMMLGLGLCSWFGYPFDSFFAALLQLVAVALVAGAVGDTLGILVGGVASYLNIAIFLGLMGYFFSDDAINALIAIFLVYTGHSVVTFLLMPMLETFVV